MRGRATCVSCRTSSSAPSFSALTVSCALSLAELKLSSEAAAAAAATTDEAKTLRDMERDHILDALQKSNWVIGGPTGAAVRLGMKRTSLLYRMEKLRISREELSS